MNYIFAFLSDYLGLNEENKIKVWWQKSENWMWIIDLIEKLSNVSWNGNVTFFISNFPLTLGLKSSTGILEEGFARKS